MHDRSTLHSTHEGSWLAAILLSVVHLLAFGMLYLVLVQINWAFQDFYNLVGVKFTTAFERMATISDLIAAYTPAVLLVVALDVLIVFRFACRGSRWTSAYSHAVLICLGFAAFFWTARSVEPMARGLGGGNRPAANVAQVVKLDLADRTFQTLQR